MSDLWYNPLEEMDSKSEVVREFSVEETVAIEAKINENIIKADKDSRINEARAIENASKAFLTF